MYLLDANVFIPAKNLHYGFDFCPAFWSWLSREHEQGKVFSIDAVASELAAGADELADWASNRPAGFFLRPDSQTLASLRTTSQWAIGAGYDQAAVGTFLQLADYYLVAQALATGFTVVTHEVPSSSTKRIKIPDACIGLRVRCLTPWQMLRGERARFVLE